MRLARLDLIRYGHFEDCRLDFPSATMDLHLVLGQNEAGKSTTLEAVTDLLFGFPHQTRLNYRFDTHLLRVGAVIEADGGTQTLVRRKGLKDTLTNADDQLVSESVLAARLHGIGREAFQRSAALDSQRLRDGGRAMLASSGDVGQVLFAAGSGLAGIRRLLDVIQAEADAVWGERRKASRTYTQAETALKDAQARLRAVEVRPAAWQAAVRQRDELDSEVTQVEAAVRALEREHRDVRRVRRLADRVQRRAKLHEEVRALPPSPFDARTEADFAAALAILQSAERQAAEAGREAKVLAAQSEAITADQPVLDRAGDIRALAERATNERKAAADVVGLRREHAARRTGLDRLCQALALPEAGLSELRLVIPNRLALGALDAIVRRHDVAADRVLRATAERQRAAAEAQRKAAELAIFPPNANSATLRAATVAAERAQPRHEALPKLHRTLGRATAARAAAFSRLSPWAGTAAALAALSVPAPVEIDTALATITKAQLEAEERTRAATEAASRLAQISLEEARLAAESGAVPLEALHAARVARDLHWTRLRAHVVGTATLTEPAAAAAALDGTITQADAVADRRFEQAEASGRLLGLQADRARTILLQAQETEAAARAEAAAGSARKRWTARLTEAGQPALEPERCRTWVGERQAALAADEALHAAQAALDDERHMIGAATDALRAVLPEAAPGASFPAMLALAELQAGQATEHAALQAATASAQKALDQAAREQGEAEAEAVACLTEWATASAGTSLAGAALPAARDRLDLMRELVAELDLALAEEARITSIGRDAAEFNRLAEAMAAGCRHMPHGSPQQWAHDLAERLERAREAEQTRRTLLARLVQHDHSRLQSLRQAAEARLVLASLEAAVGTTDPVALEEALSRFARRRQWLDELRLQDGDILAQGDGLGLDALLEEGAGADVPALAAKDEALTQSASVLQQRMVNLAERRVRATLDLNGLDHGDEAMRATAEIEQAKAAMSAEADTYLLRRSESILLSLAIERYRQRQQDPLLARAGGLFSLLTLGRYGALQVDASGNLARLIAVRTGGSQAIDVTEMSEGTADQLFLALRLAALEQTIAGGIVLPFVADDLFVSFDDPRAEAGFQVLGQLARQTQVLFFTHHEHLRAIAERALHPHVVSACTLESPV